FTRLKIDRSFVRDLQRDPDALAIVRALTGLCADLGVRATAEGVESERQAALLRAERCGEMQGFLIGRPVPPDAVARVIARLSDPRHVRPVLAAE
ncbi:MAG: EAL domain-containing protein, partial [Gluconacetobacter diazotrophicus]|nr:EAL domain-containing protein [Gluconacetobacter diazotrophicus]